MSPSRSKTMVWPSGLTSSDIQVPRVTSMGMSREGPGGFCTSHLGVSAGVAAGEMNIVARRKSSRATSLTVA